VSNCQQREFPTEGTAKRDEDIGSMVKRTRRCKWGSCRTVPKGRGQGTQETKEQGHKVPTMEAIFGGIPGFQDMMTYKPTAAMGRTRGAGSECPKIRLEYCYDGRKI